MKKQILFLLFTLQLFSASAGRHENESGKTKPVNIIDENIQIYRIELRLVTANGKWDGTDNEVFVQLNRNDEAYFLDYGRDDFNRNSDQRFDIISDHIRTIKDIDFIKFGVKKDDQWGIKKVELYLNNSTQPVFSFTYNTAVVLNKHPGQNESFVISSADLRSNTKWLGIPYNTGLKALPIPVKFATIKSIIESMIGNQLHHTGDTRLQWGGTDDVNTVWGDWVEGKYIDANTLHFDLDLEYAIPNSPDAEIDVDFDLVFSCDSGNVIIKTANVKPVCTLLNIGCDKIIKVVNYIISYFGYSDIKIDTEKYKNTFNRMFTIETGENKCHSVIVGGGGDVIVL